MLVLPGTILKPNSDRERLCCTLLIYEGQKPETAVQGLHLLSFGTALLIFHIYMYLHVKNFFCMYMYVFVE